MGLIDTTPYKEPGDLFHQMKKFDILDFLYIKSQDTQILRYYISKNPTNYGGLSLTNGAEGKTSTMAKSLNTTPTLDTMPMFTEHVCFAAYSIDMQKILHNMKLKTNLEYPDLLFDHEGPDCLPLIKEAYGFVDKSFWVLPGRGKELFKDVKKVR